MQTPNPVSVSMSLSIRSACVKLLNHFDAKNRSTSIMVPLPAADNYYIEPEEEPATADDGSKRSSVIFIPHSDEVDSVVAEENPSSSTSSPVKSRAESMEITISVVSVLLQALIMYVIKNDSNLNVDTDTLGARFDNYTRALLDNVMPEASIFNPEFERPGLTVPFDDGLPRAYLHDSPKVIEPEGGCTFDNSMPIMRDNWSPVRVTVCEHNGEASVQINEWIDKLPYDGVILSPHEFYGLEYLHDSIVDELVFLDRIAREGAMDAGCVLPVPIHHV